VNSCERMTFVRSCPVCGKRFEVPFPEEWAYRERRCDGRLICSWRCLRESEKRFPGKRGRPRACAERDAEVLRLWRSGVPLEELCARYGLSRAAIDYAIERARQETDEEEDE